MRQVLGPGALGRPRGIRWRGRWEGGSGWGTHVNPWLIHFNVWQNPLQYCKVISLQLIKKKVQMMQQIENDKMVGFNPTIPIFKWDGLITPDKSHTSLDLILKKARPNYFVYKKSTLNVKTYFKSKEMEKAILCKWKYIMSMKSWHVCIERKWKGSCLVLQPHRQ